jgi:hypothetical protein
VRAPGGGFPLAAALSLGAAGLAGGALVAVVWRRRRAAPSGERAQSGEREAW